jgi:hypothetical protein
MATKFSFSLSLLSDREFSRERQKEKKMICRICGEEFTPARNHPGYINVCLEEDCRAVAREPQVKPVLKMSEVSLQMKHKAKQAGVNNGLPDWNVTANVEGKQVLDW